jgi:hypothetical protein
LDIKKTMLKIIKQKYSLYIRIGIVILFSYLISHFLVTEVFLSFSPKIRPDIGPYLAVRIDDIVTDVFGKEGNKRSPTLAGMKARLKQLSPGVRASEIENISYTEIDLNEIKWKKISYKLADGRVVTLSIPEDEEPPPIEVVSNF